ncbi:hypothetical protein [Fusobacterium russii]|uniref:hypothetical protein n=1 Tax=Fusobacterium russii TaxID=854 RepID=UPI0003AA6301|nr:hypothetical protein [Fusobacterium russii]
MISIRENKEEIIIIQNNESMYNLLKSIYFSLFIIAGIFSILKNNIDMIYINGITCLILYFLSIKIPKIKKKVLVKLNTKKLKIYLTDKNYILTDIKKVIIKKEIYGARKFCYVLKLKLINEQEIFLLKSIYWRELNQVKKIILKHKMR